MVQNCPDKKKKKRNLYKKNTSEERVLEFVSKQRKKESFAIRTCRGPNRQFFD